jgi:hypothetical protein
MRIYLDDPDLVPSLLAHLRSRVHVVADAVGPNEVEVSQLGSDDATGRRRELDLMLRVWRSPQERAQARIVGEDPARAGRPSSRGVRQALTEPKVDAGTGRSHSGDGA